MEIEKGYRRIVEQEISPWEERKYEDEQLEEKWKGEDKQGTLDLRSRWVQFRHLTLRENRTKLEKASSSPEFFIPTSINLTIPPLSSKRRPKHQIPPPTPAISLLKSTYREWYGKKKRKNPVFNQSLQKASATLQRYNLFRRTQFWYFHIHFDIISKIDFWSAKNSNTSESVNHHIVNIFFSCWFSDAYHLSIWIFYLSFLVLMC